MFMRSTKAALLTGAVLAAVLAPAGAASAQNLTVDDATADVWEDVWNYETNTQEYHEAGSQTNDDVVSTVVKHLPTKLVLKFTYADLKRSGARFGIINHLRFVDGPKIVAAVDTNTRWKGIPVLAKEPKRRADQVPPPRPRHRLRHQHHRADRPALLHRNPPVGRREQLRLRPGG
jgi:hypothetical protein